jgi:hypothetical protein
MKKHWSKFILLTALLAVAVSNSACKSNSSYEYKPGKGWVPN